MCNEEKNADLKPISQEASSDTFSATLEVSTAKSQNLEIVQPEVSLERLEYPGTAFLPWLPDLFSTHTEQGNSESVHYFSKQYGQHNESTLKRECRSNIDYQGPDTSAKDLYLPDESQVQSSINHGSFELPSDCSWKTLMAQMSTLGDTEAPGTVVDRTALDYPVPGSTVYNGTVENGFLTNSSLLENGIDNGLYPSSLLQYVGDALQLTESKLPSQMTRPGSIKRQSKLPESKPTSFNAAALLEEGHAQVSKTLLGAFELPNKKRVAEATFALKSKMLKGDSLLQTLDEMNGIMSECGVNTTEEETSMLPKLTERRRSSVQEERGVLFLEKKPLQDKVAKLANDLGVPLVNEDVELCLSLSLEEFFRRILNRLVRVSDQSQDMAKGDQNFVVTSDVGVQIRMLRQKAREALKAKEMAGQKQAEKTGKKNKKAKEKTIEVTPRRTAETDEMLIKWEIMAEQARLKRESEGKVYMRPRFYGGGWGGCVRGTRMVVCVSATGLPSLQKKSGLPSLQKKREPAGTSSMAASGRPQGIDLQALTAQPHRDITIKDLISVLEMDPYMAKSTLLYQFFERVHTKLHQ